MRNRQLDTLSALLNSIGIDENLELNYENTMINNEF